MCRFDMGESLGDQMTQIYFRGNRQPNVSVTGELTALVFGETFETGSVTLRIEDKDSIIAITRYDVDPETLDEIRDNGVGAVG